MTSKTQTTAYAVALFMVLPAVSAAAGVNEVVRPPHEVLPETDQSNTAPFEHELVKLEESLQWTGRQPIELPKSILVTDLLPNNC
jgi:hypothetical protein